LIAVIWSLGLITLLGTAAIVGARYRTKMTTSLDSVAVASAAAESAINLGIMTAMTAKPAQTLKVPLRCWMPGGERVTISLEQEAGKVDLNSATPAVLARLFTALTGERSAGSKIAGRIVALRDSARSEAIPRASENVTGNATKIGFTTIMQLDRIDGITPRLFRTALRFVTVRSGRPEPIPAAASPALREALNLDQQPSAPAPDAQPVGDVTIRADVRAADGTRFVREALVSIAENGRPYLIHEWRHGDLDPSERALTIFDRADAEPAASRCFAAGATGAS
jgi:general secretion pathway protein K